MNRTGNSTPVKQHGFTLLEVLIASFILFMVITAMTLVYRGALLSSGKAERALTLLSVVEPIAERISTEMHQTKLSSAPAGQGELMGVEYRWQAELVQSAVPAPEPGEFGEPPGSAQRTFKLWQVTAELSRGSHQRTFQFKEITW